MELGLRQGDLSNSGTAETITLRSDHRGLVESFRWAVDQALAWVRTDADDGNIPSYWAGYPSRPMFYSRDVVHQSPGAHLLGLDAENFTMIRHFAGSATTERGYFPIWSFHFDGRIADLDYRGPQDFVREIPIVFELVECAAEQYRWTGDRRWLDDPVLRRYYTTSLNEFISANDPDQTGLPRVSGTGDIFLGGASYNEQMPDTALVRAADGLACQYAALCAIRQLGASQDAATRAESQARALQRTFLAQWWSDDEHQFAIGDTEHGRTFTYGIEASWFPLLKGLSGYGPQADQQLDFIVANLEESPPKNIEACTYLPEMFFAYGRDEQAWRWIQYLASSRNEYPEVSYTHVAHSVVGLLGIVPDVPRLHVETLSHLPEEIGWVEADHVRVGEFDLAVRHDGHHRSTLTVNSGPGPITWLATFDSSHLTVDGTPVPNVRVERHGRDLAATQLSVPVGKSVTIEASS